MNALAKKLQIKPGKSWLLYNAPENYLSLLEPLPEGASLHFEASGRFDGVQLFVMNSADLKQGMHDVKTVLNTDTIFWVMYPKKSSGIKSDLEMTGSWSEMEKYGLTGVAAAAVDQTWTAMRFRPVGQSKVSATRNSALPANDYGAYIDVTNREVNLPADVANALQKQPAAMNFYQSLSYSNKKEYVLWILTAKQEKTRLERLGKMVDKLLQGKRNPAEK